MRVLVIGSRNWVDYNSVMRHLTIVLEDAAIDRPEDKRIVFVHTGAKGAENMTTEYIGKVEKYLRQKGYSVKEELFLKKYSGEVMDRMVADYDMITSGIDTALVFMRGNDKRASYCIRILNEMGIPVEVVRDKA